MSAPAPARSPRVKWAPSPIEFICECLKRVKKGDTIFWLMGYPQLICVACAKEVLQEVLEVHELKELWANSPEVRP